MKCAYCEEEIMPGDLLSDMMQPTHANCALRMVIGSVAHVEKRCSCYITAAHETDPPGMTKREAADAAAEAFRKQGERL
jgi:hypothetical protein